MNQWEYYYMLLSASAYASHFAQVRCSGIVVKAEANPNRLSPRFGIVWSQDKAREVFIAHRRLCCSGEPGFEAV